MRDGFRKTRPREVVLSVLKESNEHLTAEQIYDLAKKIYPEIGFSSVYRTLKLFEDQGIVEAINIRGMKRCFQLKKQVYPSARIHLICTDCNKIMDLPDGNETFGRCIEKFKEVLREKYAFDTSVFDVRIFGRYDQKRKEMIDMPFGDGTGPLGQGPLTGRRGGGRGRGMGRGMGRGRGMGINRGVTPIPTPTNVNPANAALTKEEEDLANKVYNLLPKINCGSCGYPTCYDCAKAIAKGEAPYNACRVLKPDQQEKIREILQERR